MSSLFRLSRRLFTALFALMAAAGAEAQLAKNSPFMPPQSANTPAPTAGAPLEFRGYLQTADAIFYRVHDPARKTGAWVKLNERDPALDVVVKQHDPEQNTLTVEHQGRALTLAGREPKIVSSGNAAQPMPMPMPPRALPANVSPAVTQSVVVNPTPADEQRRLEAVAAEVARRRALREQAAQQINQGGAAPGVAAPPPQAAPQRNLQQMPPGTFPPNNLRSQGARQQR